MLGFNYIILIKSFKYVWIWIIILCYFSSFFSVFGLYFHNHKKKNELTRLKPEK